MYCVCLTQPDATRKFLVVPSKMRFLAGAAGCCADIQTQEKYYESTF